MTLATPVGGRSDHPLVALLETKENAGQQIIHFPCRILRLNKRIGHVEYRDLHKEITCDIVCLVISAQGLCLAPICSRAYPIRIPGRVL